MKKLATEAANPRHGFIDRRIASSVPKLRLRETGFAPGQNAAESQLRRVGEGERRATRPGLAWSRSVRGSVGVELPAGIPTVSGVVLTPRSAPGLPVIGFR